MSEVKTMDNRGNFDNSQRKDMRNAQDNKNLRNTQENLRNAQDVDLRNTQNARNKDLRNSQNNNNR